MPRYGTRGVSLLFMYRQKFLGKVVRVNRLSWGSIQTLICMGPHTHPPNISHWVRSGLLAASGQNIKNLSVEKYLYSVGHIFASVGFIDPRIDLMEKLNFASTANSQNVTTMTLPPSASDLSPCTPSPTFTTSTRPGPLTTASSPTSPYSYYSSCSVP